MPRARLGFGSGDSGNTPCVTKRTLPRIAITYTTTRSNTGTRFNRLIGRIPRCIASLRKEYIHPIGPNQRLPIKCQHSVKSANPRSPRKGAGISKLWTLKNQNSASRFLAHPHHTHQIRVLVQQFIGGEQICLNSLSLGNEQAVDWVAALPGQVSYAVAVVGHDR